MSTIAQMCKQYDRVTLLLQGGGALGSYQAGVYEGLHQAGIEINSIAGISIGALNTCIIAGNKPKNRVAALRGFWDTITRRNYTSGSINPFDAMLDGLSAWGKNDALAHTMPYVFENQFLRQQLRLMESYFEAFQTMMEGQKGFFKPRYFMPFNTTPNHLSYYTIDKLKDTLAEFADLRLINDASRMRVSVGAVNVRTGNYAVFTNEHEELRFEHFMASGALPPGFPAVEIDGEYYWDGGLVSNTPLNEIILADESLNQLIFFFFLWNANDTLPENLLEVDERVKAIQYSSRTRMITTLMRQRQHYMSMVKQLLAMIPEKNSCASCVAEAEAMAEVGQKNVIHLIYRKQSYERGHKDYEFSANTMQDHWQSGLYDMNNTLRHEDWFARPSAGEIFTTHNIHEERKKFSQNWDWRQSSADAD